MKPHFEKKVKNITFLIFSLFLFSSLPKSFAQSEQFSVDYNLEYKIDESGETEVTQVATITNLQNDAIPTAYSFSAKQLKIYDISANTNGKEASPRLDENNGETVVSVTIRDFAIGEGRQNKITLNYKTKSIASQSGKIWNIYIPKIQIPDKTTLYDVKLSVPKSFGPKIYLSPTPVIEKSGDGETSYFFTRETFQSTGITAGFGEFQPVNFKVKYQIKNNSILPAIKEIALPPDIKDYQNVSYDKINPKPYKVKLDEDGNLIAYYTLKPKQELEIEAVGTARLHGKQINQNFGGDFKEIPSKILKNYTRAQKYWETKSPYIQKIAQELQNENQNVVKSAQKIYDFIGTNLTYDFEATSKGPVERRGAEAVASQKNSWTCMEFTDLFIATARAMSIPAREINGYAFAFDDKNKPISINLESGDFLHSWAEFYDSFYGWVQIDPTWGTTSGIDYFTKLDTNHFAFVVKGLNSEYPFPAGTYRLSENEKLIEVALSQSTSDEDFKPALTFKKVLNLNPINLIKNKMKIKVENVGKVSAHDVGGKIIPVRGKDYILVDKNLKEITFKDTVGNEFSAPILN